MTETGRIPNHVRTARTKAVLVRAAAEAFDESGFAATSLGDIVARTPLTKGAVYAHFASKDELAVEVVNQQAARWEPLFDKVVDKGAGALDTVMAISYEIARLLRTDVVVRAGMRLALERHLIEGDVAVPYVSWTDRTAELLALGQRRGEVSPDIDARAAARVIVAALSGVQRLSSLLADHRDLKRRLDEMWLLLRPPLEPSRATTRSPRRAR
ncbi:MAG: ScbR family autoregulator-binding transcription factor [Frankiaceae bacterium]